MLIKNSVTRVAVRHHEACWVMPNSYPSDIIFNLHQRTIMDSFSCILFPWQLHLDLNMFCLSILPKITTFFDQGKFDTAPLFYVNVETFGGNWRENDVKMSKMMTKSSYWHHAWESSYTPHVRWHFLAPVRYARKRYWNPIPRNIQWTEVDDISW